MRFLIAIWGIITLKPWRARREGIKRRARYDEIKALVVERHLSGFGGTVLSKKYDAKDLACFAPPMYQIARTDKNEPVLCWRKELMTEEVGPPRPKPAAPANEFH